jgi:hypothetical protein
MSSFIRKPPSVGPSNGCTLRPTSPISPKLEIDSEPIGVTLALPKSLANVDPRLECFGLFSPRVKRSPRSCEIEMPRGESPISPGKPSMGFPNMIHQTAVNRPADFHPDNFVFGS